MFNTLLKKVFVVVISIMVVGAAIFYAIRKSETLTTLNTAPPVPLSTEIPPITDTSPATSPVADGVSPPPEMSVPISPTTVMSAPQLIRAQHVFVVMEENHGYEDTFGNVYDMPYLNHLATTYAYAKNFYANTHPSIGNYFMLTTGKIITNNDSFSQTVSDDNIVRQLIAAGKTWKEYSETIPAVGYTGGDADPYEQHHNPLSYFSDVRGNSTQLKNLVPISQLASDIANHTLPNFAFIVPDNTNNAHDCPTGSSCTKGEKLAAADKWLKTYIEPLLNSPDFDTPGGGLLIIVFDEASKSDKTNGGGHVFWVIAGPDIKNGYAATTGYQFENMLRVISEASGLTSFPGKATGVASMQEFFKGR